MRTVPNDSCLWCFLFNYALLYTIIVEIALRKRRNAEKVSKMLRKYYGSRRNGLKSLENMVL